MRSLSAILMCALFASLELLAGVGEGGGASGEATLELRPLDPGVVFEKIIINWNGAKPAGFLFGPETK